MPFIFSETGGKQVSFRPVSEASSVFTDAPIALPSPPDGAVSFQDNKLMVPTDSALWTVE